uniref:Uncharacterized protein n=1 Tax=Oryza punctata TaxID=4537 RepID=A0A0E0KTB8_ORYPU
MPKLQDQPLRKIAKSTIDHAHISVASHRHTGRHDAYSAVGKGREHVSSCPYAVSIEFVIENFPVHSRTEKLSSESGYPPDD